MAFKVDILSCTKMLHLYYCFNLDHGTEGAKLISILSRNCKLFISLLFLFASLDLVQEEISLRYEHCFVDICKKVNHNLINEAK